MIHQKRYLDSAEVVGGCPPKRQVGSYSLGFISGSLKDGVTWNWNKSLLLRWKVNNISIFPSLVVSHKGLRKSSQVYDLSPLLTNATTYSKQNPPNFRIQTMVCLEKKTSIISNRTCQCDSYRNLFICSVESMDRKARLGCSFIAPGLMHFIHGKCPEAL